MEVVTDNLLSWLSRTWIRNSHKAALRASVKIGIDRETFFQQKRNWFLIRTKYESQKFPRRSSWMSGFIGRCLQNRFIFARRQPCRQFRARFSLKLDKNRCSAKMGIARVSVWACRAHLMPIDRIWHSRHDSTWFRRSASAVAQSIVQRF